MDVLAKVAAFMGVGAIVLALNLWYFKALYNSFGGSGIVIAPIKVYGADESSSASTRTFRDCFCRA